MIKKQFGAALVEFALIALVFFTVVFGLIEWGRLLFTMNTLTEMTRRGARLATVCPPSDSKILHQTLFNSPTDTATSSHILPFITTAHIRIKYLDHNGCDIADLRTHNNPDPTTINSAVFNQIKYVNVQIINYTHNFIFPPLTIPLGVNVADSCVVGAGSAITNRVFAQTVLPRESLGVVCTDETCATLKHTGLCPP